MVLSVLSAGGCSETQAVQQRQQLLAPQVVRCDAPVDDQGQLAHVAIHKRVASRDSDAEQVLQGLTVRDGIPIYESRAGAPVAIYLDFDGGTYDGDSYDGAQDAEPVDIVLAALQVSEAYGDFNINVTTDRTVLDRPTTRTWAWILIEDSWGSSGEASVPGVGRTSTANGIAGSSAVFLRDTHPQAGYLLIHEVGHMFGLNHSGRNDGAFLEWSELRESRLGGWLGGRDSHFTEGYDWKCSQTKYYGEWWQVPERIIEGVANVAAGVGPDGDSPLPAGCETSEVFTDLQVSSGQAVAVRFSDFPATNDWIGIFPWGANDNDQYLDWAYTGQQVNGNLQFNALPDGCYEARAFLGDGDQLLARSGFAVGDAEGPCVEGLSDPGNDPGNGGGNDPGNGGGNDPGNGGGNDPGNGGSNDPGNGGSNGDDGGAGNGGDEDPAGGDNGPGTGSQDPDDDGEDDGDPDPTPGDDADGTGTDGRDPSDETVSGGDNGAPTDDEEGGPAPGQGDAGDDTGVSNGGTSETSSPVSGAGSSPDDADDDSRVPVRGPSVAGGCTVSTGTEPVHAWWLLVTAFLWRRRQRRTA